MANETQNCGYPKPDTDDFYNIEDFNRAIDMIDGDIGEIQEAVSALGDGKADKKDVSQHLSTENPHNITKETVGLGNVPNVATDDQTPTFTQAASRENIASGEKLSVVFGKIGKWLADLKAVAFTGSYNDLADRPAIPTASTAAPRAAGTAAAGTASAYARGDHVHPLQTSVSGSSGSCLGNAATATKATQDGEGNVIADTYAKRSIYGNDAVSMGRKSATENGMNSFAFGFGVTASGRCSCARGEGTVASGECSSAEGWYTAASGKRSHAEGNGARATADTSHAEGYSTEASNFSSHAMGKLNKEMKIGGAFNTQIGDVFVIGNGTVSGATSIERSNALRVTFAGDILGTKAFQSSGADYAEFIKPWADGNPESEDRVGYFVTIKDGLLYKAQDGEYIAGITSGNPSVLGNADEDYYWRYERDAFNRIVMEDVPELVQETDGDGNLVFDEETHEPIMAETGNIIKNARMKLAEGYDPALQESYIPRAERPEWSYVGMLGVLPVRDDGTCVPGRFCRCGAGGIATLAEERGTDTFFVIERKTDSIVSVILK